MIILIAALSVAVAFFTTRAIIGTKSTDTVSVPSIVKIDTSVTEPDPAIFNSQAINPAVEVQIAPKSE